MLRVVALFSFLLATPFMAVADPVSHRALENARWEHRVLLHCQSMIGPSVFEAFLGRINQPEFQERDLIVLTASENSVDTPCACQSAQESLCLIGKDGTLEARWLDQPPSDASLFAIIDAMPMRRQEIRDKGK